MSGCDLHLLARCSLRPLQAIPTLDEVPQALCSVARARSCPQDRPAVTLECTILSQAVEEGPRLCRLFRDLGRKYNTSLSTAMFGSVPASPGHRKPRMCNTPHNRRYSIRSDSQCSLSARDISSLMFLPTLSRDLLTSTTLRCCALANRGFRDVRRTG
jgi:hypothetical protein